jgi:plastocyanin
MGIPAWPKYALRITFGGIWLIDAVLKWLPGFRSGYMDSIKVINADPGTAHGLVITAGGNTTSWMPMMTARPAFPGTAAWFLGNPTPAGMHAATLDFTATTPGSYRYLCPVPGHAQKGMTGAFTVSSP